MSLKQFKAVGLDDEQASKFQQNVAETFTPILRAQILDGILLRDIVLITGQDNIVPHKLGRLLMGWQLADINADARVWRIESPLPSKNLLLNCSANCTISLWVY